jgi:hypothetical protein
MGITINIDKQLVNTAKAYSTINHRSMPKQIEHWAKIGRIAEENPDLTYDDIKNILLGLAEVDAGYTEEYKSGSLYEDSHNKHFQAKNKKVASRSNCCGRKSN